MNYMYEAYSDSKYRFAVKKSSKISYQILLLSDTTFFKLFFHIFAAITEVLIVPGHKFLYTFLIECGRP
jgi:heme/copper-type cytochrome/quinol oxidase subunit 3